MGAIRGFELLERCGGLGALEQLDALLQVFAGFGFVGACG
jgi:hypothetical protein